MDYKDVRGLNAKEIAELFTLDELLEIYSESVDTSIDDISHYNRTVLAYKIREYAENGFVLFV